MMNDETKKELMEECRIGITLGDVAGVGPEVAVKALIHPSIQERCIPILIGELSTVKHYADKLAPDRQIRVLQDPSEARLDPRAIYLVDLKNIYFPHIKVGQIASECGRAALEYIRAGVDLCLRRKINAIVTGPIHKEAARLAGLKEPGHTEFLASLCKVDEVRMLLVVNHLRAMHISTHLSLRQALDAVKKERIVETIHYAAGALRQLRIAHPRIAVAGLNPHAGEGGMFGHEEAKEITPAVRQAQDEGLNVAGPISPDTVFHRMNRGEFDLVIALYHDQGHIPLKLIGFDSGVNVTIGLPIVRTSVDHGTAFDIAGKLIANPESMVKAIELACVMAETKMSDE
jgi:4-phospho-D-threonate 3-dehydrogenase / 4-phospho-D-erythronate 3-dehydrogenase